MTEIERIRQSWLEDGGSFGLSGKYASMPVEAFYLREQGREQYGLAAERAFSEQVRWTGELFELLSALRDSGVLAGTEWDAKIRASVDVIVQAAPQHHPPHPPIHPARVTR